MHRRLVVCFIFAIGLLFSVRAAAATVLARVGDASISHDASGGTWAIAAGGATLTLNVGPH